MKKKDLNTLLEKKYFRYIIDIEDNGDGFWDDSEKEKIFKSITGLSFDDVAYPSDFAISENIRNILLDKLGERVESVFVSNEIDESILDDILYGLENEEEYKVIE